MQITNLVAKWPGSVHDARILRRSRIFESFEDPVHRPLDGIILGDSGYMLREWLMTPIPHPRNQGEEAYNEAHRITRSSVERLGRSYACYCLKNIIWKLAVITCSTKIDKQTYWTSKQGCNSFILLKHTYFSRINKINSLTYIHSLKENSVILSPMSWFSTNNIVENIMRKQIFIRHFFIALQMVNMTRFNWSYG